MRTLHDFVMFVSASRDFILFCLHSASDLGGGWMSSTGLDFKDNAPVGHELTQRPHPRQLDKLTLQMSSSITSARK